MALITFIEHQTPGYKARTIENAKADMTIAIAKDFNTSGEKCTRDAVKLPSIYVRRKWDSISNEELALVDTAIAIIKPSVINIAGNGIYTLKVSQSVIDELVYTFLARTFIASKFSPNLIRSGGQTGIDEAALKAAVRLGIPALCLAPKYWMFRQIDGTDIVSEQLFKARFNNELTSFKVV